MLLSENFQTRYPTGSLIFELHSCKRKFIVHTFRLRIRRGVARATEQAAAGLLELAEDRAEMTLAVLVVMQLLQIL